MPSAKARTALLCLLLVSAVAMLCLVYFAWRSKTTKSWVVYSPSLVRSNWESQAFISISASDAFKEYILETLKHRAAPEVLPRGRIPAMAAFIYRFLNAYSHGSFDAFWQFRAPNSSVALTPNAKTVINGLNRRLFESVKGNSAKSGLEISSPPLQQDDPKLIYEHLWRTAVEVRKSENLPGGSRNEMSTAFCTECVEMVALASVEFLKPEPPGRDPNLHPSPLMSTMRRRPNVGILSYAEALRHDIPSDRSEDVYVEILIKTKNGGVFPTSFIAGWDKANECYVPIAMGHPISARDRVKMIF